jgi:hypothetical protein
MDASDLGGTPHTGDDAVDGALSALGPLDADPTEQVDGLRMLSDTLARLLDAPRSPGRPSGAPASVITSPGVRRSR